MNARRARDGIGAGEPVALADGRRVWIRPVRASDLDELRRAIREADAETLRLRFLGGRAPRTDAELRHLVEVDHAAREALAAFTEQGRGVGIARYESVPGSSSAEFAVAVDPAWRRVGVATALLARLLKAALHNGITTIHVDYFAENRDVADLIRRSGQEVATHVEGGVVDEDVTLDPESLAAQWSTSRDEVDPSGA